MSTHSISLDVLSPLWTGPFTVCTSTWYSFDLVLRELVEFGPFHSHQLRQAFESSDFNECPSVGIIHLVYRKCRPRWFFSSNCSL